MSNNLINKVITGLKITTCVIGGISAILTIVGAPIAAPIALVVLGIVCEALQNILESFDTEKYEKVVAQFLPNTTKVSNQGDDDSDTSYDLEEVLLTGAVEEEGEFYAS